jgi:hypothetical protein
MLVHGIRIGPELDEIMGMVERNLARMDLDHHEQ